MKIAVITAYDQNSGGWLADAHHSVRAQTEPAHHIMVCDGAAPAQIEGFQGTHILLPRSYNDRCGTARLIGCFKAAAEGADAIAFLDPDRWYYPNHLRSLSELAVSAQLGAVACSRVLHRLDGSILGKCPTVDGREYIDASGLMVMRAAFPLLIAWVMQGRDSAADVPRVLWRTLRAASVPMAFVDRPTVAFRTAHPVHYEQAGDPVPEGAIAPR